MCQRVTCRQCGKPTFAGCGRHIEQVLGDVPPEQRCRCREASQTSPRTDGPDPGGVLRNIKNWWT
jgi:hypothetical protein